MLAAKDTDETMAADWAAIREKHAVAEEPAPVETEKPETPEPEKPAEPLKEPEQETAAQVAERTRDEQGRFQKEAKKPEVKEAKPVVQPEETPQPEVQRDLNRAPSTWRPTARAEWGKLPPAIRAEIHKREADFMSGQSQLLPDAKLGESVRRTMQPYQLLIEAEGSTPEKALADIMRTAAVLRIGTPQQKYQAFADAARQYGVDLAVFAQQPQQGQQPGQPQPQFRDPRVDQLLGHLQQQDLARVQREQTDLENSVTRWMNETDEKGEPRYPYLGDVINEMSALIPQLKTADPTLTHDGALKAAYERAIWASPEIRALLQQKQQSELDAQRRTDNQTRVASARRAASVNVPRRASTPAPVKPGSLEETITATARELGMIS